MKNKPYNVVSSEGSGGDGNPPSSPPSPRRQTSGFSQCRRRLRSKVPLQYFRKYSLAAGIFGRRNIQFLLLLFFLYFSGLMMCVGRFSNFLRHSREPIAIYKSHLLLEKFWHDIETDNSTALEVFSLFKSHHHYYFVILFFFCSVLILFPVWLLRRCGKRKRKGRNKKEK
jgi:uncharacterized membrane protein